MILDQLKNHKNYDSISSRIAKALEYLAGLTPDDFESGRTDLEGDDLFVLQQAYRTEPLEKCRLETHRKYIDIQYILEGKEIIRYAEIGSLQVEIPYDEGKDVAFYETIEGTDCLMRSGDFAIFFPTDGHMPKISAGGPGEVKKVVVKIAVD